MAIAIETGIANVKAASAAPARTKARRISSVAYADDEMASELKMASALTFDRRSPASSSEASGRPRTTPRILWSIFAPGVVGMLAASLAVSWPGPV